MKDNIEDNKFWDKLGLCTSTLCLIHCVVPPILMIFLPMNTFSFLKAEFVHDILSVIVIGSIILAVYPNCKKHEHLDIIGYAFLGVFFIVAASFAANISNLLHVSLTMIGSLFLITSHVKNIKVRHGKCSSNTESKSVSCNH